MIKIEVLDQGVTRAFAKLERTGSDLRPVLGRIGAAIAASTKLRFRGGVSPSGVPWRALTSRSGKPLLNKGTHLANPLHHEVAGDGRSVVVGVPFAWASVHQYGKTIVPKSKRFLAFKIGGKNVFARKVTIPARPFLGISAGDKSEIARILASAIEDARAG